MKARFLALWSVAVFAAAAAFIAHLSLRLNTVQAGYAVDRARHEQRRLIGQKRMLSLEAATLRQPERIETVARGLLDMDVPEAARVIPVGRITGGRRGRRVAVAGRVR